MAPERPPATVGPFLSLMHVLLQPLGYRDLAQAIANAVPQVFAADTAVLGVMVFGLSTETDQIEAIALTKGPSHSTLEQSITGRPLQDLSGDDQRESNVIEQVATHQRAIGATHLHEFLSGFLDRHLLKRLEREIGWRSGLAIPLTVQQRSVGVLLVALGKEQQALTVAERTRMTNIGHVIGLALEQARLYEEERRARQEIEQAQEQGQTFLRIVAHDLKTPLTNVMGYAQLTQRLQVRLATAAGVPTETYQRTLAACDKIVENCRRLQRMVDDLQETFRLGSGRFDLQREQVDLVSLIRGVIDEQRAGSPAHAFALAVPDQPVVGEWDAERLRQTMVTLVTNAVKYSPDGGPITVTVRRRAETAVVTVADGGLGIAKEDLPALFRPQSRGYRDTSLKGSGMGLYIAKGIAEAHGGKVRVDSPGAGKGATFTVVLPLQPPATGPANERS